MYVVGAQVVTTLPSVRFIDFVKDRIFTPLNMTQSTFLVHEALRSGQVSETWTPFGRRIPLWMEGLPAETMAGPGGVISNVNDLVRGMLPCRRRANCNRGRLTTANGS